MEKNVIVNVRRFPRCVTKLNAYFPEDNKVYYVTNISYKGCFIEGKLDVPLKKLIYFEIELPDIGNIPIYGIVVHKKTVDAPGIGIEIIDIDKKFKPVWVAYLKAMYYIEDAKKAYEKAIKEREQEKKRKKTQKEEKF